MMSSTMCHVNTANIPMLRSVGIAFVLVAFFSLLLGKTYCKRTIFREDEPGSFWVTIFLYFMLGIMILLGTIYCPETQ